MNKLPACKVSCLLFGLLLFPPTIAEAGEIVAIIEEAPQHSGLVPMDYVDIGRTVQLAENDTLVLGYLSSCIREVIIGGSVRIGTAESEIVGGTVTRTKVDCAGGGMQLSEDQAQQSGVMISRSLKPPKVHSLQPVFSLSSDGVLKIMRQDKSAEAVQIAISGRKIVDLADENISLEPGGVYRAEIDGKRLKFSVSQAAKPGKIELLSRFLAF
jgi:hypothetical protein